MGVVISIHALREEGDDVRQASPLTVCLFLSTPSARRATYCFFNKFFFKVISIHALREEGDNRQLLQTSSVFHYFYPRPPRGGRPGAESGHAGSTEILSTPSARRATLMGLLFIERSLFLSTPSARRATAAGCSASSTTTDFYPRPPRGGRPRYIPTLSVDSVFLSTPSARRATCCGVGVNLAVEISIHALREEGDAVAPCCCCQTGYFIHALREEGDGRRCPWPSLERHFLSTPSARRATP